MLHKTAPVAYRNSAVDTILQRGANADDLWAEAASQARQQRLAAERTLDAALADSFPASDPPSWTPAGTQLPRETAAAPAAANTSGVVAYGSDVIDLSRPAARDRAFLARLVSLAGATGLALLVPVAILLVGLPIVLAVRGVVEAARWLVALIAG